MTGNTIYIDPTSAIDEGVQIGNGTKIWHFSHVSAGARLGSGCILGQNVFIGRNVHIGDRVKVQNNVSIYEGVSIEDDVFVGPSVVFTNVINPRSFIGRKQEYQKTKICRGASLGANCTIICGITVGNYALVGAGSVVTKDVLPYAIVAGNPSRQVGWTSETGEKLAFGQNTKAFCESEQKWYYLEKGGVWRGD